MGTNFYAVFDGCPECGRFERRHLGKLSHGWVFLFAAHPHTEPPLTSWWAWRAALNQPLPLRFAGDSDRPIIDEYDRRLTVAEFVALVERSQTGRCHLLAAPPDEVYHDADGHDFYEGEFS